MLSISSTNAIKFNYQINLCRRWSARALLSGLSSSGSWHPQQWALDESAHLFGLSSWPLTSLAPASPTAFLLLLRLPVLIPISINLFNSQPVVVLKQQQQQKEARLIILLPAYNPQLSLLLKSSRRGISIYHEITIKVATVSKTLTVS